MENHPAAETPAPRSLTSTEARDFYNDFRERGIPLPDGVLGVGMQRLGTSNEWAVTVYANSGVDASGFIEENLSGLRVVVEEPGTAQAYPTKD